MCVSVKQYEDHMQNCWDLSYECAQWVFTWKNSKTGEKLLHIPPMMTVGEFYKKEEQFFIDRVKEGRWPVKETKFIMAIFDSPELIVTIYFNRESIE